MPLCTRAAHGDQSNTHAHAASSHNTTMATTQCLLDLPPELVKRLATLNSGKGADDSLLNKLGLTCYEGLQQKD